VAVAAVDAAIEGTESWTWGSDGRTIYVFYVAERDVLRIGKLDPRRAAPLDDLAVAAPTREVRGLAVSRRGAFIARESDILGSFAPTAINGAWTSSQTRLRGAEIIGMAGVGHSLLLACLEGEMLTLRRGSGISPPPVQAAARWTYPSKPGWLRVLASPESNIVWLWGSGVRGRADLSIGEILLTKAPEAPEEEPSLEGRHTSSACIEIPRPSGYVGLAPVPLADGRWGVMNLADGGVVRPSDDLQAPLAATTTNDGQGLLAIYPSFLLHAELIDGRLSEWRMSVEHVASAALTAGSGRAIILIGSKDSTLSLLEVDVVSGAPPSYRSQTELRAGALQGGRAMPTMPPLIAQELVVAAADDRLSLWTCPFAGVAG